MAVTTTPVTPTDKTKAGVALPPPPPRTTGDKDKDFALILNWMNDFYKAIVVQKLFVTAAEQSNTTIFDPSTLPDPATSTIAKAQNTANEAYALASNAKTIASTANDRSKKWAQGSFTISGTTSSVVVNFGTAQAQDDDKYQILASAVSFTGSPVLDALVVISTTKTKDSFTIAVNQAPGAGNSVTFNWVLVRGLVT